jgi:Protein of unknown function (DUF3396)
MNSQRRTETPAHDLDLERDDLKLARLTFGINLYTNASFYDYPDAALVAFEQFLAWCPLSQVKFYATETMNTHKPVSKRVLGMLPTWLKPDAPRKKWLALELKSGDAYQDAPEFKFHIWAVDMSKQANLVSLAVPAAWGIDKSDEMLQAVHRLCDVFPFHSGLAGFALERSHYEKKDAETYAWRVTIRHPGVDIVRVPDDARALGGGAVKGVGWLTLLGQAIVDQRGGVSSVRRQLGAGIEVIETKNGVIVKAGPWPEAGDVNRGDTLPLYARVYEVVAPWIRQAAEQSVSFQLVDDFAERTVSWYSRLRP